MNAIFKSLFLAAAILLLGAGSAMAYTVNFGDDAIVFPGWGNGTGDDSQDVVGIPNITGGSATFSTSGGVTYLNSVTFYLTVSDYPSLYSGLTSGDLFINSDDDTSWNYVVDLPGSGNGSGDVYGFNHAYSDSVYALSNTVYGPGNIRENHPVNALGGLLGNDVGDATFTGLPAYPGGSLTISGLNLAVGDYITLGYTVSCANDVIFARINTTPIPGAVWLLGTGLLGLIGLRSRFKG